MIKLEIAHIEEIRGIWKLDIDFEQKTFAISGPNGSGKTGVIDAIEFGLTGKISRLTGTGTKTLSIAEHGPHVDQMRFPDAALVELKVYFPALKKSATITRTLRERLRTLWNGLEQSSWCPGRNRTSTLLKEGNKTADGIAWWFDSRIALEKSILLGFVTTDLPATIVSSCSRFGELVRSCWPR